MVVRESVERKSTVNANRMRQMLFGYIRAQAVYMQNYGEIGKLLPAPVAGDLFTI